MSDLCPCGSSKHYSKCCGRFLDQGQSAKTPEQLMRSRYTAYALGRYGRYIYDTWFNPQQLSLSPESLDDSDNEWLSLEIVSKSQKGNEGYVEFKAHYISQGQVGCLHESSKFIRENSNWFYLSGKIH